MPVTADLLEEIATLKAMLIAADARDKRKDERIARLEKLGAALKQAVFGRKSEKSDPDQFELALEDLEMAMAVIHAEEDTEDRAAKRPAKPHGECLKLCVSDVAHAVFRYVQASKRPANILAIRMQAATHSQTARPSFSKLRIARKISLVAASSVGKEPLVFSVCLSIRFSASSVLVE
jgi:hypothetical protein